MSPSSGAAPTEPDAPQSWHQGGPSLRIVLGSGERQSRPHLPPLETLIKTAEDFILAKASPPKIPFVCVVSAAVTITKSDSSRRVWKGTNWSPISSPEEGRSRIMRCPWELLPFLGRVESGVSARPDRWARINDTALSFSIQSSRLLRLGGNTVNICIHKRERS